LAAVKRDLARWFPKDAPDAPRATDYNFDPATVTWNPK
jgi:hypothetical protein